MKRCTRCGEHKPTTEFAIRAASKDGFTPACKTCINNDKQIAYWVKSGERENHIARALKNKRERFARDPAYKKAFNLRCSTRRRTTLLKWVPIMAFYDLCSQALELGPEYVLDHIVPLNHPQVCGLHVPWNMRVVTREENTLKGNEF